VSASFTTHVMGWLAMALVAVGVAGIAIITAYNSRALTRIYWNKYIARLNADLRFLFSKTPAEQLAYSQIIGVVAVPIFALVADNGFFNALIVPVVVGPYFYLQMERKKRVDALEAQLDQWLLMLANALKASPSLGESIESSAKLIRAPFAEEVDLVIKETKLGTPLDQALINMSDRLDSRIISGSLATILVGRQTGGDLPAILEQSAATLREMARLEGVVRTKTAEGKSQAMVLAVIPYILLGILNTIDPDMGHILFHTVKGNLILAVAFVFWLAAVLLARKILAVDI
jgi:tight adherence protein B